MNTVVHGKTGRVNLAMAGVRGHSRRLVATGIAIILGVAFVTTTLLLLNAARDGIRDTWSDGVAEYDYVTTGAPLSAQTLDELRALPEVDQVLAIGYVPLETAHGGYPGLLTLPASSRAEVVEGRLPSGPGEVVISTSYAQVTQTEVGQQIVLTPEEGWGPDLDPLPVQVTGVLDVSEVPDLGGTLLLFSTEEALTAWSTEIEFYETRIGTSASDSVLAGEAIAALLGDGHTLRTGQQAADDRVAAMIGEADTLGMILLGFGAVGLVTSALVIANTFTIVLAQRSRELALLRCLGATRPQVRRSVLIEAGVLGVMAASIGVAVGAGVAALAAVVVGPIDFTGGAPLAFSPSLIALGVPWLVGVVMTVAAAVLPSIKATRIAPVAALAPRQQAAPVSRAGILRIATAVVLIGAGGWAVVHSATTRSIELGLIGGVTSFLGVMVAAVVVLPALLRLLGLPARSLGVPGRLAVGHVVSNPGRAAATSVALLIGVTLITMTSVGAATATRSALAGIDSAAPVDVILTTPVESDGWAELDAETAASLTDLDTVAAVAAVTIAEVELQIADDHVVTVETHGVQNAEAARVFRDDAAAPLLNDGAVGSGSFNLAAYGLQVGEQVTLRGSTGVEVAVTVADIEVEHAFVIDAATMAKLEPDAPAAGMYIRVAGDGIGTAAMADIQEAMQGQTTQMAGPVVMRDALVGALNMLVLITTALLAVAVLIAVVGIANSLSLSVLERAKENALLRALGLTRSQLRATLATEGLLLALASTLLGIGLGIGYAYFGVQALLPESTLALLDVPVGRVILIASLAAVAGLAASVLPAQRASRIAPAQGLASV